MLLKELRTPFLILLSFFLLLFLYTKLAGPIPFSIDSVQTTKSNLFQVTGEGKIAEAPDSAHISFGVTKTANTVADAQNQTNTAIASILDAVKKMGVEEKDIKTTNYSISPNQNFDNGSQTITGYTATQNIDLHIQPISKVNTVIDNITASGANMLGQVSFGFADDKQKELEDKARTMAVQQAKDKAESLAKAAGIRLGKIIDIQETPEASGPIPLEALSKGAEQAAPTQVTPGENTISLSVTLSFETN